MRALIYILLLILTLSGIEMRQCLAQNYADKDYYLVDSLDIEILIKSDRDLLDSCLNVYHQVKEDTNKIEALTNICEFMVDNTWRKYQYYQYDLIKKALLKKNSNLANKKLQHLKANALRNIGIIHFQKGNLNEALKVYKQAMVIYEQINDQEGISHIYNNQAMIYNLHGDIANALLFYHKSLIIKEKVGDDIGIAQAFNNLGIVYKNQGEYAKSIEYYNKSLKLKEKYNDEIGVAVTLHNIGSVYLTTKKFDLALPYFLKSLKIKEDKGDKKGIAESFNSLGALHHDKKEFDLALDFYLKALKIREEINTKRGIVNTSNNLASIYISKKQYDKAIKYAQRSLLLSQEMGSPDYIANSSKNLYQIYEYQNKGKEALKMYKLYITMRDSIFSQSTQKATAQQQAKYEYEKQKAVDDAEHEKQIAIEQEAKAKQKVITYAIALGLGLVVIFLIFVFNRLQVTKKQKIVIEAQKVEVEKQKEVVELAHNELEEKNQEITDSIQYAKRIQNAILPPLKVVKEYLQESFILYKPKDIVAGDFYWLEHKDNKVLFAAADCTGHGVPGAMVSVVCNNGLNRSVREFGLTDPGEILTKTREIVIAEFEKSEDEVKDGMDIALCSLTFKVQGLKLEKETLNPKTETAAMLQYAGANNPLWIIRNNEIIETKADKQPIGQFDNPEPYTTHTIELLKGDSIYIFSDGYADQFGGEKGKKLKTANFKQLLLSIQDKPMEEQKTIINEAFETWKGSLDQIDDVCVIGVRI